MKKIILIAILFTSIKASSQVFKSNVLYGGGVVVKVNFELILTDSTFSVADLKSGSKSNYIVTSKGLNSNYKVSDGVKEYAITIQSNSPTKIKGFVYDKMIVQETSAGPISYYCTIKK